MARNATLSAALSEGLRHWLEILEDRVAPAITVQVVGQPANPWTFSGPAGIDSGSTNLSEITGVLGDNAAYTGLPNADQLSGSITGLAVSRQNAAVAYAVGANGGIVKTLELGNQVPRWSIAGSDDLASTSFRKVVVDPTNPAIAFAASGFNSFFLEPNISDNSIYWTQDGGNSWRPIVTTEPGSIRPFIGGLVHDLDAVAETGPSGPVGSMYAATEQGLYRFGFGAAGSRSIQRIAIPGFSGKVTQIQFVQNPAGGGTLAYVAAAFPVNDTAGPHESDMGIFRATVTSAGVFDWGPLTAAGAAVPTRTFLGVTNVTLAARATVEGSGLDALPIYVAAAKRFEGAKGPQSRLSDLFRVSEPGGTVTYVPLTVPTPTIHPNGLAIFNTGLAVHPADGNVLFLGGDAGPLYRLTVTDTVSGTTTVQRIDRSGTISGSTAPPNVRQLQFRRTNTSGTPEYELIAATDSGLFALSFPLSTQVGDWTPRQGAGLATSELFQIAIDPRTRTLVAASSVGSLDQVHLTRDSWNVSPVEQKASGEPVRFNGGAGAEVAVDGTGTFNGQPVSIRYYFASINSGSAPAQGFYRAVYGADGKLIDTEGANAGEVFSTAISHVTMARPGVVGKALQEHDDRITLASGLSKADQGVTFGEFAFVLNRVADAQATPIPSAYSLNGADGKALSTRTPRMVIGHEGLYESTDGGIHVTALNDMPVSGGEARPRITALAYGAADFQGVIYAARIDGSIRVRQPNGTWVKSELNPGPSSAVTIIVDPNHWKFALAIDVIGRLFRTRDGGATWKQATSDLSKVTGTYNGSEFTECFTALAVAPMPGGKLGAFAASKLGGVYAAVLGEALTSGADWSTAIKWVRWGQGLPNVPVNDVIYDTAGDRLVVATSGRGAWTLTNPTGALAADPVLRITGTDQNDFVTVSVDPDNPARIAIRDTTGVNFSVVPSLFRRIEADLKAGNDSFAVDSTYGVPRLIEQFTYEGGSGTDTAVISGGVSKTSAAGGVIRVVGDFNTVIQSSAENLSNATTNRTFFQLLGDEGAKALESLDTSLAGAAKQPTPFIKALTAGAENALANAKTPTPAKPGRLVEVIRDVFSQAVTTDGATIESRFRAQSGVKDVKVTTPAGGGITIALVIEEVRQTLADLGIGGEGNNIQLDAEGTVACTVTSTLNFGVDDQGFYIDTSDGGPSITSSDFKIVNATGQGRFGITDVSLSDTTMTYAPGYSITRRLKDIVDTVFGTPVDGKLRNYDIFQTPPEDFVLETVNAGDASMPPLTVTSKLTATPLGDGTPLPTTFPASGVVQFVWNEMADPENFVASAASGSGSDFFNLSRFSVDQLIDGLRDVSGWIAAAANSDVFAAKFGPLGLDLGSILNGDATPVSIANASIQYLTPAAADETKKYFTLMLSDVSPAEKGIAIGDSVEYDSSAGRKTGVVAALTDRSITISFPASEASTPNAALNLTVQRAASLQRTLQSALGELSDPLSLLDSAPTLQSLLPRLKVLTGQNFTLSATGDGASRMLVLTGRIDPAAVAFTVPLDLAQLVPGLSSDGPQNLAISLDPVFDLRFGLRLDPDPALTLLDRFVIIADGAPQIGLTLSASLDNPSLKASLGFLNVALGEDASVANNTGISIAATLNVQVNDPASDPDSPGVATIRELTTPGGLGDTFTATISGQASIPGLTIAPSVGGVNPLGTLGIKLDAAAGKFTTLDELLDLPGKISLTGNTAGFLDFSNLTPAMIFDAIKALIQQLTTLSGSGPLAAKLPVLNKSLGELVDLGNEYALKFQTLVVDHVRTAKAFEDFLNPLLPSGTSVQTKVLSDAIEFAFQFNRTFSASVPVQLDLQNLGGVLGLDLGGNVAFSLTPTLKLTLGFRTGDGLAIEDRVYLNTSASDEIVIGGTANAGYDGIGAPINGAVSIAGLSAASIVQARIKANPTLTANLTDVNGDNRLFLSEIKNNLGNLSSMVSGSFTGLLQGIVPIRIGGTGAVTPPDPTITEPNTAWVSVLGKLSNIGNIDFQPVATSVLHNTGANVGNSLPDTSPLVSPTHMRIFAYGVDTLLTLPNINLDLLSGDLLAKIPAILTGLADLVRGKVNGMELPLVGTKLRDVSTSLFGTAAQDIATRIAAAGNQLTPDGLKQLLFDALSSLGAVGDWDNNGVINLNDVELLGNNGERIQFNLRLKKSETLASVPLDSKFGFSGLGITLENATLNATAEYDVLLRFGFSKRDGFYFDTTNASLPGDPTRGPEEVILKAGFSIANGFQATGTLGFLVLKATKGVAPGGPNGLNAAFTVNLKDPVGTDGRLLLSEFQEIDDVRKIIDAKGSIGANLAFDLALGFAATTATPALKTTLFIDWNFLDADPLAGAANFGPKPNVSFGDVKMDVGGTINSLLLPIMKALDPVLDAVRPLFDVFNVKIPGLGDLAQKYPQVAEAAKLNMLTSNPPGTVGDLVALALKAFVPGGDAVKSILDIVGNVQALIDKFKSSPGSAGLEINFGPLNLGNKDIRTTKLSSLNIDELVSNNALLNDARQAIRNLVGNTTAFGQAVNSFLDSAVMQFQGKPRKLFEFPLFDNPKSGLQLLLGKDVELFKFSPPKIDDSFGFSVPIPFPLFPALQLQIFAQIPFTIDLTAGFDTVGFRKFFNDWQAPGGSFNPETILEGFYLTDIRDSKNPAIDKPEVVFGPELGLKAGLNLVLLKANVVGGLKGDIQMFLHDCDPPELGGAGDGKVRFGSINFSDPGAIADINGKLTAGLRVELEIGVWPVNYTKKFPISPTVTLLTFDSNGLCPGEVANPNLATVIGNVLTLNVGPRANLRGTPNATDGDERVDVVRVDADNVEVRFEGFKQTVPLASFTKIAADGGTGDDSLRILPNASLTELGLDPLLAVPVEFHGGAGNDTLGGGKGADALFGDAGNDLLMGDAGNDQLFGGDDADELQGGTGLDTLSGDAGDDVLSGGDDADTLNGNAGNDTLSGDAGNDTLFGGDGDDDLAGDVGDDVLQGEAGHDTLSGGEGNDQLFGGAGNDALLGDEGNDALQGGADNDVLAGGDGIDTLDGGDGNDDLSGENGDDILLGGPGADRLSGGAGADTLSGGDGADEIDGGAGTDTLNGDAGNDLLLGGAGNDTLNGNADADNLDGGAGNDTLNGNAGADRLFGNAGNDTLAGNEDADALDGGDGDDRLLGSDGNDTLSGGVGNDVLLGELGNDTLDGGPGRDILWGGFETAGLNFNDLTDAPEKESEYVGFSPRLRPVALTSGSQVQGTVNDGLDMLFGGEGNDALFGGGDADALSGGAGDDYLDGGLGSDSVSGDGGEDLARGGAGNDTVRGNDGRDWVFGDADDDMIFGDAGTNGDQQGQRLYGGDGSDTLFAYAATGLASEWVLIGDEIFGGEGIDFLYGNLRRDTLFGGGGGDFLHGDYNSGPAYIKNTSAGITGGADILNGGLGQDQLYGGGGNDILYGGEDGDWLEGQSGSDILRGGFGVDILVMDTDSSFTVGDDSYDGFGGNASNLPFNPLQDQLEVDILLVQGDSTRSGGVPVNGGNDAISIVEQADGNLAVSYTGFTPGTPRTWQATWKDAAGKPMVEQIQISGLQGDDAISVSLLQSSVDALAYTKTWVTVIGGGPGKDALTGSAGPDRLDGGPGSDTLLGSGGDDRLFGDTGNGSLVDIDTLYGGLGNDDLVGGKGGNNLFAWSDTPYDMLGVFRGRDLLGNLMAYDSNGDPLAPFEDTGLNRALGSPNSVPDNLYGGTGLDFLFGNGPLAPSIDKLFTKDGKLFEDVQNADASGGDEWKEFARQTNRVWYLAGSNGNDKISINFVTNPYNPFFGRHLVSFQTTGAFDPRYNGFDNIGAFDRSDNRVGTQGTTDTVIDAAALNDPSLSEAQKFAAVQSFGAKVLEVISGKESFDAIIIDALAGDDVITVGETVQATVWTDGGPGNDSVLTSPTLAFLPDVTDPRPFVDINGVFVNPRNDTKAQAYSLGSLTGSAAYKGLTFDSNRSDQPDVDWYKFQFAATPTAGDVIRVLPRRDLANLNLKAELINGAGVATAFTNGTLTLSALPAATDFWLRIETLGGIPVDYDLTFNLAADSDLYEPNDSKTAATNLDAFGTIPQIERLTNLTVGGTDGEDWFSFTLPSLASGSPAFTFETMSTGAKLQAQVFDLAGAQLAAKTLNDAGTGSSTTISLAAGFTAGQTYRLRFTSNQPTAYELRFAAATVKATGNATPATAYVLPQAPAGTDALSTMPVVTGSLAGSGESWFQFTLTSTGLQREAIGVRGLASAVQAQLFAVAPDNSNVLKQTVQASPSQTAALSFLNLEAGTYRVKLMLAPGNTTASDYELNSFTATAAGRVRLDLASYLAPPVAPQEAPARRDVLLGGTGNDTLQGGSGEDWIFGGEGNDLLTGGVDGQASDLIYGEAGDDRLQVMPSLRTPRPDGLGDFDNAGSDYFDGGDGRDRAVYSGADGVAGKDFVVLGFDKFLHRYRVGALTLQTDPNNPNATSFLFDSATNTWALRYSFFQARNAEGMLVETRGGADVVRADGGFVLNRETWGVERGDVQNQASLYDALTIDGGSGQDAIWGGVRGEVILGGADNDHISGGDGNDRILGETGNDRLAGSRFLSLSGPQPEQNPSAALLDGTPLGSTFPVTTPSPRNYFSYSLTSPEPQTNWTYVSPGLPESASAANPMTVADRFAFEGAAAGDKLARMQRIGDFNGDGIADYLVGGTNASSSYLLFGPLTPDLLTRVETRSDIDPSTAPPDLRVRGENWAFEVPLQDEDDQVAAQGAFRIGGQAQARFSGGSFVFAKRQGDVTNDGLADIVSVQTTGSGTSIRVVNGTKALSANLDPAFTPTTNINVLPGTAPQAFVMKRNNVATNDLFILGESASAGSNVTIGQMYYDGGYVSANVTQKFTASFQAGAKFNVAIGDYNNDGFDDLLLGITDYGLNRVGRVYLIPSDTTTASATFSLDNAKYIWEGPGLGAVYSVGDLNRDGIDDIAFGRVVEGGSTAKGAVFVIPGALTYTAGGTAKRLSEIGTPGFTVLDYYFPPSTQTVLATITRGLAAGEFAHGAFDVTAGDFDGEGRVDLAVGLPASTITASITAPGTLTNNDPATNRVYVFDDPSGRIPVTYATAVVQSPVKTLVQARLTIMGEAANDGFGNLGATSRVDFDGDRIDDLVIGAGSADVNTATNLTAPNGPSVDAGRVYTIFGSPIPVPTGSENAEILTNREVPGSGLYLVEQPDGQPFRFESSKTTFPASGPIAVPTAANFSFPAGSWNTTTGEVTSTAGQNALAIYQPDLGLSDKFRLEARMTGLGNPGWIPGVGSQNPDNRYIVFDYVSPTEFKFAGVRVTNNNAVAIYNLEIGRMTPGGGGSPGGFQVLSSIALNNQNYFAIDFRLDIDGSFARASYTFLGGPPNLIVDDARLSHDFGESIHDHQFGLLARNGAVTRFENIAVTDTGPQWYRFSTLGDGRIGDQIAVKSGDSTSQPKPRTLHSTGINLTQTVDLNNLPALFGNSTGATGFRIVSGSPTTTGTQTIGGPNAHFLALVLDLTPLLSFIDTPELIDSASFKFNPTYSGAAFSNAVVALDAIEDEPNSSANAARPIGGAYPYHAELLVSSGSTNGTNISDGNFDITALVRDSLRRGRTRIGFKLSGGPSTAVLTTTFNAGGIPSTNRFEVITSVRPGAAIDVYDGNGARIAIGQSIIDLRDAPAGNYLIRVVDPLQDVPGYTRPGNLNYRLEIEAPKVGDADVVSDRDQIRGGDGNDIITGGDGFDLLFGSFGKDTITGAAYEFQDAGYFGIPDAALVAPPPTESQILSNGVTTEDVVVFPANNAAALNLIGTDIGRRLGIVTTYTASGGGSVTELIRPIYATDLNQLVELIVSGRTHIVNGLEYATNLETLRIELGFLGGIGGNLATFVTGLRTGRESQGLLGLKSLRILDVKDSEIATTTSPVDGSVLLPTAVNSLAGLEYLNFDFARLDTPTSGSVPYDPWPHLVALPKLRRLSMESVSVFDNLGFINNLPIVAPTQPFPALEYLALNNRLMAGQLAALGRSDKLREVELRGSIDTNKIGNFPVGTSVDPFTGHTVLDNRRDTFVGVYTEIGAWTGGSHSGAFQSDYRILPRLESGSASYEISVSAGRFDLAATWPAGNSHTDQAKYEMFTNLSPATPILTVQTSQGVAPVGDLLGGRPWQTLGTMTLPAGTTTAKIVVTNNGLGHLVADAVRLTRRTDSGGPALPDLKYLDLRDNITLNNEFFDYARGGLESKLGIVTAGVSSNGSGSGLWYTDNPAPTLPDPGIITMTGNGSISVSMPVTDTVGTITYGTIFTDPTYFAGASIIASTLILGPQPGATGAHTITVRASDGGRVVERDLDVRIGSLAVTGLVETRVNTTTVDQQRNARVAVAPNGDSIFVWQSFSAADNFDIFFQRFDRFGIKLGSETKVNIGTGNFADVTPDIGVDGQGGFQIVWQGTGASTSGDIIARRFNADGTPQTGEVLIGQNTSNQTQPAVATSTAGDSVVVWTDRLDDAIGNILGAKLTAGGVVNGSVFIVDGLAGFAQTAPAIASNGGSKHVITYNGPEVPLSEGVLMRTFDSSTGLVSVQTTVTGIAGTQSTSRVAMNATGESIVTWVDFTALDGSGAGVFAMRFDAAGVAGAAFRVNGTSAGDQSLPAVTLDSDGTATFVWQDKSSGNNDVRVTRFGRSGWTIGEQTVHSASSNEQTSPAIALVPGRADTVLAWTNTGGVGGNLDDINTRLFHFDGQFRAGVESLLPATATFAQQEPAIAAAPDGTSVAVWIEARTVGTLKDHIFAQRYDASGAQIGTPIIVQVGADTNISGVKVSASNAGFLVSWIDTARPFARRYAISGGTATPGPVLDLAAGLGGVNATRVSPTIAGDGRFAAAWFNGTTQFLARRFNADGSAIDAQGQVAYTGSGLIGLGAGLDSSGHFTLMWSEGISVFLRRFAAGSALTSIPPILTVSTSASGAGADYAMAADGSGVALWNAAPTINARRIAAYNPAAPADAFLTGEITALSGVVFNSAVVAIESDGSFAAAVSTTPVRLRRFTSTGTPTGPDLKLDTPAFSAGNQQIALTNGHVLAVFTDSDANGGVPGALLRRFSPGALISGSVGTTEGVEVFLDRNANGTREAGEPLTVTDISGRFEFRGLTGQSGQVRAIPLAGTVVPTPSVPYILEENARPTFAFTPTTQLTLGGDVSAVEGQSVLFTPAISGVSGPFTFSWVVFRRNADGTVTQLLPIGPPITTPTFTFDVPDDGTYLVAVSVSNGTVTLDSTARIFAQNALPVLPGNASINAPEGQLFTLTANASDVAADLASMNYEWYREARLGEPRTLVQSGTGPAAASFSATFPNDDPLPYVYTVRVLDDNPTGTAVERSFTVTIVDAPPSSVAVNVTPPGSLFEGDAITLLGSFVDPGLQDTHTQTWTILNPQGALHATGSGASIPFTPTDNGDWSVTYTVQDKADLAIGSKVITIPIGNVAPTVQSIIGTASTIEEATSNWSVSFTDAGAADTHTIAWAILDSLGATVHSGNGLSFAWTPPFSGLYTLRVTVTDDDFSSTVLTQPLTVHNLLPRMVDAGTDQSGPENSPLILTGTFRDPGVPDDAFTANWSVTDGTGTLVFSAPGTSVAFTPPNNGAFTATFTVTNTVTGLSSSDTALISASNVAPTAGSVSGPDDAICFIPGFFSLANVADAAGDLPNLRYSFATSIAGLAADYAAASPDNGAFLTFTTPGTPTVFARAYDPDGGVSAIVSKNVTVTALVTFTVNGGDVQRSRIFSLTLNYAVPVNVAALGDFTLTRTLATASGTVGTVVSSAASGANGRILVGGSGVVNSLTLTFDNADGSPVSDGVEHGSLADGRWQLAIPTLGYTSALNDPSLRRLFGDFDNNGTVEGAIDFPAFGADFNLTVPNSPFDFDNNGIVDGAIDFPAFGARFNTTL